MSKLTYVLAPLLVVALSVLSGCGDPAGGQDDSAATSTSSPTAQAGAAPTWPAECHLPANSLRASIPQPGVDVYVVRPSSKKLSTVALLSNQSDEDLCSWLPLTKKLAGAGIAAAVYNYSGSPLGDIGAIAKWLRAQGAAKVAYVGASEGAKASLISAAQKPAPSAVVSLSAEESLGNQPVAPYVAGLHMPLLFVTASNDPYGSTAATKGFHRRAPAKVKPLIVKHGRKHGTAMLDKSLTAKIVKFVQAHAD